VNATLVTHFWRQRLMSPLRMVFLLIAFSFPLLFAVGAPSMGLAPIRDALGFTLVMAVGMIGQDVSSGVLQLLFARPVRRSEYVLSRWFSVWSAATALATLQVVAAAAILAARGAAVPAGEVGLAVLQRAIEVAQIAAVFAALSSLVNGFGDVGVWIVIQITGGVMALAAQARQWVVLGRIADEIGRIANPSIALAPLFQGGGSWVPVLAAVSTTAIGLAVAVVLVNRKELSYASG
jgi:hypothetical protein